MVRVRVRIRVRAGVLRVKVLGLAICVVLALVLAVHQGLWCYLCWGHPGVIFDRVRAELLARNELSGAGNGADWLAGNGLVSKQRVGQPYLAGRGVRAREGAQAARLLHRRHLLLAGRLALHVVHLHMVWWIVLVQGGC